MKRLPTTAVALVAVLLALSATAHTSATPNAVPPVHCTAKAFAPFSKRVWSLDHWNRGKPPAKVIQALRRREACAGTLNRAAMRKVWQRDRLHYGRYRAFRLIAPYPGGGTYWAIPAYIVECESHYSWSAANPSGAVGPYQLLGWGAPYPAATWHEKMENHRIAHELYVSQGASPWVCG